MFTDEGKCRAVALVLGVEKCADYIDQRVDGRGFVGSLVMVNDLGVFGGQLLLVLSGELEL